MYNESLSKRNREIDMLNCYNSCKVESLKAKRYTLQSSDLIHPVNYHHNFSQTFMLTGNH